MDIQQVIDIKGFSVPTILLFMLVGFFTLSFVFWRLGKKEGFDEEKLFDLLLISLVLSSGVLKVDPLIVITIIIFAVYLRSYFWKWSTFRILDVYSLALMLGVVPPVIGYSIIYNQPLYIMFVPALAIMYMFFSRIRNIKIKSGYSFSLILLFAIAFGLILSRDTKHLLFYSVLFIISLANIYLRERKEMATPNLPLNLINKLRNDLLTKRKRLKIEQKVLIKEDPYMEADRTGDNAELMDEAILEDRSKEVHDVVKSSVDSMLMQVRKALGRMRIGKYGMCEVCGKSIDPARLKAYPEATTCVEHAPKN